MITSSSLLWPLTPDPDPGPKAILQSKPSLRLSCHWPVRRGKWGCAGWRLSSWPTQLRQHSHSTSRSVEWRWERKGKGMGGGGAGYIGEMGGGWWRRHMTGAEQWLIWSADSGCCCCQSWSVGDYFRTCLRGRGHSENNTVLDLPDKTETQDTRALGTI